MGTVTPISNKVFNIRAVEANAHFMGIMMGGSVKREGGKLVAIKHDLYLEIPLGHWVILKDGKVHVQAVEPVPF